MKTKRDQRIEDLSRMVGGRFKLTTLIVKRMREYYLGGRTFMPRVRHHDELFDMVLDQIENESIVLRLPDEPSKALDQETEEQTEPEPDVTPEELLGDKS